MNERKQRSQIVRFLKRKRSRQVDVFCLYQWLDRCYYQRWWELGVRIAVYIPSGTLSPEYQKRVGFLALECRNKLNEEFIELKNPGGKRTSLIPRTFWNACEGINLSLSGKSDKWLKLNYETKRIVIIGRIREDGCSFRFNKYDKSDICDLLRKSGLEHLESRLLSKGESRNRKSWLKLAWEEATTLIPLWTEHVKRDMRGCPAKAITKKNAYFEYWKNMLDIFHAMLPNITKKNPTKQSYLSMPSGHQGIHFEWYFRERRKLFCVSIHFEHKEVSKNKNIFDYFFHLKDDIKKDFPEEEIIFEREWGRRWAQIYIARNNIDLDDENLKWGINNMLRFYIVMNPLLDSYFDKYRSGHKQAE